MDPFIVDHMGFDLNSQFTDDFYCEQMVLSLQSNCYQVTDTPCVQDVDVNWQYQAACPPSTTTLSDVSSDDSSYTSWHGPRDVGSISDIEDEAAKWDETSDSAIQARVSRSRSQAPSMGSGSEPGWDSNRTCRDCSTTFTRVFELEEHAKISGHKPFGCEECDSWFPRRDSWRRHANVHSSRGRHPCPYCPKYQEKHAFKRKDHLRKHLRNVHGDMICPRNIVSTKIWSEKQCVRKDIKRSR